MSAAKFKDHELKIIFPEYNSKLTNLIIELNRLRGIEPRKPLAHPVFAQLKIVFHMLESLGSARIEGNHTTLSEYAEAKLEGDTATKNIMEIDNLEKCMDFIESTIHECPLDNAYIREIHKRVVANLGTGNGDEGDKTPGSYRTKPVKIANADHLPPEHVLINDYMEELIKFINDKNSGPLDDLLRISIAHHRFTWIHPFANGNGRTVRLLTFAMLIKSGFIGKDRLLNPTAIFCIDRNEYYRHLSLADAVHAEDNTNGILLWNEYVLNGLKIEIEKINRLLDYTYLSTKILNPTIDYALSRKLITELEEKILKRVVQKPIIRNSDLQIIFAGKKSSAISRHIKSLIDKKMLSPIGENKRQYQLCFVNNYLLRGIILTLEKEGFIGNLNKPN